MIAKNEPVPLEDGQIENVQLTDIILDRDTQIRVDMCEETVQRYFDAMENEKALGEFPPVRLIRDSDGKLWLADGHHRVTAAARRKFESITAIIRPGTKAEAIWEAAKANGKNGLQLGRADVRRAVEMILTVLPDRSNRAVAEVVGCSHEYVRKLRESSLASSRHEADRAAHAMSIGSRRFVSNSTFSRGGLGRLAPTIKKSSDR